MCWRGGACFHCSSAKASWQTTWAVGPRIVHVRELRQNICNVRYLLSFAWASYVVSGTFDSDLEKNIQYCNRLSGPFHKANPSSLGSRSLEESAGFSFASLMRTVPTAPSPATCSNLVCNGSIPTAFHRRMRVGRSLWKHLRPIGVQSRILFPPTGYLHVFNQSKQQNLWLAERAFMRILVSRLKPPIIAIEDLELVSYSQAFFLNKLNASHNHVYIFIYSMIHVNFVETTGL